MLLRSGGALFIANIKVQLISSLLARCYKLGYCLKQHSILDIRRNRDMKLWQRIFSTSTALSDLLPPQRTRQMRTTVGHIIKFYLMSGQVF